MNKIAMYEMLLQDHPLWNKEAEELSPYEEKRLRAAIIGGIPTAVPLSTLGSGLVAPEGRRGRAMLGQLGGAVGGSVLGAPLGVPGMLAGQLLGGGAGTYYAIGDESIVVLHP